MMRFMLALLGFAAIAGLVGFFGIFPLWSGFARGLFYLYAGMLGVCALIVLLRRPAA